MTVFARFSAEFPDREETRILMFVDKVDGRERGRVWLDERFCADPDCDCQTAMIHALEEGGRLRAAIFYDLLDRTERTPDGENPFLEPGVEQPEGAELILAYVQQILENDTAYRERLRRHYRELKDRVRDPKHPLWPAVLEDRRLMTGWAQGVMRQLAGAPPTGPDRARRERNRRKRNRKRK